MNKKIALSTLIASLVLSLFLFIAPAVHASPDPYESRPTDGGVYESLTTVYIITPTTENYYFTYARAVRWFMDEPPSDTGGLQLELVEETYTYRRWEGTITNPSGGLHEYTFRIYWRKSHEAEYTDYTEDVSGTFAITRAYVLNLEPYSGIGEDSSDPPLPIMPYVAGYDDGYFGTTTRVRITVNFPDTSPSVIPEGNYLAGGMFLQGQESRGVEPWRHTDYGFLASLSLDHTGMIQYNMAFYRTHEPTLQEGAWYECAWKSVKVLDDASPSEPVTLTMQWDNGWVKWFYTIDEVESQADAYYALDYSYSIIQKFFIGHHEDVPPPLPGAADDFYYFQFGIYSETQLETSGWNVRLEHPMYYDTSNDQWKYVSKARLTQGSQSYIDHWWRWGGQVYSNVGARYYENGLLQEEYVVEFYGADGAHTPLNWLLWGRWFSPTGYSDPDGGWSSETNAYDDDEDTYATTAILYRDEWSKFLYLTHSAITCDRIRVLNKYVPYYCYYDIDVYKDAAWIDVFDGYLSGSWDEISFTKGSVTQMRVRVRRVGGTAVYILRLYEADFLIERGWISPTGYSDPDGGWSSETNAYDDDEDTYATTAILYRDEWSKFLYLSHSPIGCDRIRVLNKYVPYYCYYDIDVYKDGASWVHVFDGYLSGSWDEISFTKGSVTQMRVRVRRVGGTAVYILRLYEADFLIEEDWFSPTGYSDPDGGWSSETNAYDDDEDTYATTAILYRDEWSKWLYLTCSPVTCNRIRVLNKYVPYYCYYDIYVRRSGLWVHVLEGYLSGSWDEIPFAQGVVTEMRVRVRRVGGTAVYILRLYEADFGFIHS